MADAGDTPYAETMPEMGVSIPFRRGGVTRVSSRTFVGRRDDLAVLQEAWAAVVAGAGRAVFVGGEPGAGKSRLVAEAAQVLYGQQAAILVGSCVAELSAPYEPFDEPVRVLLAAIRRSQIPLEDWGAAGDKLRLSACLLSVGAGQEAVVRERSLQFSPTNPSRVTVAGFVVAVQSTQVKISRTSTLGTLTWTSPETRDFGRESLRQFVHVRSGGGVDLVLHLRRHS